MAVMPVRLGLYALAVFFFVLPWGAQAHSLGSFYEEIVGLYLVDIGYDPPEPMGGSRLLFDLNLFEAGDKTAPVPFESVWVRIEHEGELLLAGPIAKMPLGPTTLIVRVPEREGELVVHARFEGGNEPLAEVSFPIVVVPPPKEGVPPLWWVLAVGLLALGWYGYRRWMPAA